GLRRGRGFVTPLAGMRGAYSAVIRFADHTTLPVRMVDRVDPEANVVVLTLDGQDSTSTTPPLTLEALARTTYEETPAQHRYLADKRARAQRWEEALVHWQRVRTLDPVLQPADAAAFTETVLHASAIAQAVG